MKPSYQFCFELFSSGTITVRPQGADDDSRTIAERKATSGSQADDDQMQCDLVLAVDRVARAEAPGRTSKSILRRFTSLKQIGPESPLLVATDDKLIMVNAGSTASPEVIEEHEPFTHGTFMAGGRIAVATATGLTLYERTAKAMVKRDRVALQHKRSRIIALFSVSAEVVGVLYASSAPNDGYALERWQIS